MSALPWKYCSVCRGQFGPDDTSGGRPVLFRCVHCSDFSSGDARSCADRSLHICIACHAKSGLYHASSHCWAKVFVSTARGAYDYKKGIEWVGKVSSSATYIASSDRSVDSPGLASILDVSHYIPCTHCQKGIYGTRWIASSTRRSYCGDCYLLSSEFPDEDVWFMRGSIFNGLPTTGPLLERPTMISDVDEKKSKNPDSKPAVAAPKAGFGFGAPKPSVRISIPGENYSDEASSPESAPPAADPQAADSYIDAAGEAYTEEGAVNLKRTSSYYDEEARPTSHNAAVHISIASSSSFGVPKSLSSASFSTIASYSSGPGSYTSPAGYSDKASGAYTDDSSARQSTTATSGYSDDHSADAYSSTASYTDDTHSTAATSVTITSEGYSETSPAGYGYSDASSAPPNSATVSIGYSEGYNADSAPSAYSNQDSSAGSAYSDQSGSYTVDGYAEDNPTSPKDPFVGLAERPTEVVYSDPAIGYQSGDIGGYSDQSTGYADDSPSGYSQTGAGQPQDPFARVQASDGVVYSGAGYSGAPSTGYSSGYAQADSTSGYSAASTDTTSTPAGYSDAPTVTHVDISTPKPAPDGSRDWNSEFQARMSQFRTVLKSADASATDVLVCCRDLYSLSGEFIENAQEIGRTIIEEVSIPSSAKSIKPVNVGGVAGGEKYVQRGIFFKFAIDAFGVYGGDEYAQKAAGHELAGLKAYYNCQIEGLNTPFMLLMDYRGYRLIATTKLPIGGSSLIYGSADGGITIHKDNAKMNAMMEAAARIINIKPHVVGMRNQTDVLYAPTDIEGHLGSDGRYYVLDTARICPPEPIHKSFTAVILSPENPIPTSLSKYTLWHNQMEKPAVTGEFWRPWPAMREVGLTTERWMDQIYAHLGVTNPGTNIVSSEEFGEGLLYHLKLDVATPVLAASTQRNRDINVRASNLVKKIIYGPAILVLRGRKGAQLFNLLRYETVKGSPVPLSSDAFTPFGKHSRDTHNEEVEARFYHILSDTIPQFLSSARLFPHAAGALQAIQQAGINTRMIGFLRSSILDSQPNASILRAWILNEMIVRVTKNYLRSKLRRATSKLKPIEPIIIKRLNLLLGSSPTSTAFWATDLKAQIVNKFGRNGQALTPKELQVDTDLRNYLNKLALFQLLQSTLGVVFTEDANGRFQVDPTRFEVPHPLREKDLEKLVATQKSLLQPELDQLILDNAAKASNGNTEKLLELSGTYLPGAESHPALALQRLHIAEKLLMEISYEMGQRFEVNAIYTSNVTPVLRIDESNPDFLRKSILASLSPNTDKYSSGIADDLMNFLNQSEKYREVLSHIEILRIWVNTTPYCPLEISCKLFYLRGCISMIHRLWTSAEAFFRTSYDCITRIANVPGSAAPPTYALAYVVIDNDRPFSLLLLDKLVHVMHALGRHGEALAFAQKFVHQMAFSAFPGRLNDLKPLFGPSPPISLTVYRTYCVSDQTHLESILLPLEKTLLSSDPVDQKALLAWQARVNLTNFGEISGFFLSPAVLQQYLDAGAFKNSHPFPHKMRDHSYWNPAARENNRQDVTIMLPPILLAGTLLDIDVSYNINPSRLEYSKGPHSLVLLKNTSYTELLKRPDLKYIVPKENIVATHVFPEIAKTPRGTITLSGLTLTEGPYLALIMEANGDIVGGRTDYWASQPLSVVHPSATSSLIICHDRMSGYWGHLRDIPPNGLVEFAISDSEFDNFDGQNSVATVLGLDEHGKVWKADCHNYMGEPPSLLKNPSPEFQPLEWGIMTDLFAWKVRSVSVSCSHTLILTDNGEVLSVGSNEFGALGHGDTVAQQDPRLVRKIKGKPITSIVAGEDRSIALDEFGTVYQWGKSFSTLPEVHPFFSGKSKASKGEKIPISKVVFQAYRPPSRNTYVTQTEFFINAPIGYLSTEGKAYLWAGSQQLFPSSEEYRPELVTRPTDPIVDIAIGFDAAAFLTIRGEVWTAGRNRAGELGVGLGLTTHLMPKNAYKSDVPYACAEKVINLDSHFITRLEASMNSFYALSDHGEFFAWGGSASWSPIIPPALKGLKVKHFSTGLRGLVAFVDQTLTVPTEHHPLCTSFAVKEEMEKVLLSASGIAAGVAPTPNIVMVGTEFAVEYTELDPAPDFSLLIRIPKTQLGRDWHMYIVNPGETVARKEYGNQLSLNLEKDYEVHIDGSYSAGKWGPEPHFTTHTPPMATGPFEVLIVKKTGGKNTEEVIAYRSPTFVIRKSAFEYKLSLTPAIPKPAGEATFHVHPVPVSSMNNWIVIREKHSGTLYGCVQVQAAENKWDSPILGEFVASWEMTDNMQDKPKMTYAELAFEVGEPLEDRPQLELQFTPSGPYYKGQSVILEWKYTKNPPVAGSQFFGGLYLASQKGLGAVMQGGYVSLIESSGTATFNLPAQVDFWKVEEYEFRAWQVTSGGMAKVASASIMLDPALTSSTATSSTTSEPSSTTALPATPSATVAPTSSSLPDTASNSSTIDVAGAVPDWDTFFSQCGFDKGTALVYAKLARNSGIPVSKLLFIDSGILLGMKISNIEHQMVVLERIAALKQARLETWLQLHLQQYAASLSPSLD